MSYNLVAIVNCPLGMAQTYMVAAALKEECEKRGYKLKVETQGVFGSVYTLDTVDIQESDVVILALGKELPEDLVWRLKDKKTFRRDVKAFLTQTSILIDELEEELSQKL